MRYVELICLFALGCAPAVRDTAPRAQHLHDSPVAVEPVRWRLFEGEASPRRIVRLPNSPPGIARFDLDGYRAEKVNGRITFANQSLSSPMMSCPSGKGYIHFARNGVFWSSTFLGDLVQVGNDLVRVGHVFTNTIIEDCGPVVITRSWSEELRKLWDEHGAHVLPAMKGINFLHFTSAREGRAIRAPDQLLVTTDGGHSFVTATDKTYPAAPEAWLGGALNQEEDEDVSDEAVVELEVAWLHHAMRSEVGAMIGATRLSDGTWVRSLEHQFGTQQKRQRRLLVSLRRTDGTIIDRQLPDCTLAPLRDRLLAYCAREGPAFRNIYPEERPLAAPPQPLGLLVADPGEGLLLAVPGDYYDYEYKKKRNIPLFRFDGTTWHNWSTFDPAGWKSWSDLVPPLSVRHGRLLICGASCVIRSALDPSDRGIILNEHTKPYGEHIRGVALLDKEIIAVSSGSEGKSVVLHFAFEASGLRLTRKYEVSDSISEVSFTDSDHGAARYYGYTMDGGKTWTEHESEDGGASTCWSGGCAMGESLLLTNTRLREPVDATEFSLTGKPLRPPSSPPTTAAPEKEQVSSSQNPEPQRPIQPPPTPASKRPNLFPWYDCVTERRAREGAEIAATGGHITCDEATRTLKWHGRDKAGLFEVQTALAMPRVDSEHYCDALNLENSPLVTRHYAVIEPRGDNHETLVVLKEDGSTDTLSSARKLIPRSVLLPDGHGLVVDNQDQYANVFLLDEHGARLAHRWILGAFRPAIGPGGPGAARWEVFDSLYVNGEDATAVFNSLMPGSQPQPMLTITAKNYLSMLTPCAKAPDPSATLVYSRLLELVFDITSAPKATPGSSNIVLGVIEFGATQVCLRGATAYTPISATLAAEHGVLRGIATDAAGTMGITCRPKIRVKQPN